MLRYKLTTQKKTTYGGFPLPATGEWFFPKTRCGLPTPCSDTVLHHYSNPLLAVLLNPIHVNYQSPRLFEIEIKQEEGTDGLKGWATAQKIVQELPLPTITITQRVAFAIKASLLVCTDQYFVRWAEKWLSCEDRSASAAYAAASRAARAGAGAAARAADAAASAASAAYASDASRAGAGAYAAASDAARASASAAARAASRAASRAGAGAYAAEFNAARAASAASSAAAARAASDAARAAASAAASEFNAKLISIAQEVVSSF